LFENRALRRIFGLKREEMAGGWRTLHNEELHDFYASRNIITMLRTCRM
jgi:PAS domain-containing protein